MNNYSRLSHIKKHKLYYQRHYDYVDSLISNEQSVIHLGCGIGDLLNNIHTGAEKVGVDVCSADSLEYHDFVYIQNNPEEFVKNHKTSYDVIIVGDLIGSINDIYRFFVDMQGLCHESTRIIISYYSYGWEPIVKLSEALGIKPKDNPSNFLPRRDLINLLQQSSYECIKSEKRELLPLTIPLIGNHLSLFLSSLPFVRSLSLRSYDIFRYLTLDSGTKNFTSASIVIPCKNEKGNIEQAVKRIPKFCQDQEIIFVEGGSIDGTSEEIDRVIKKYPNIDIKHYAQTGRGKGDAVRLGFSQAKGEVLMIQDADLTVGPEYLPRFFDLLNSNRGEFLNGSRLIYPMEKESMRVLNFLGNMFFAKIFSWLLNQRMSDVLCGTKVLSKKNYDMLIANREYFGEFDPFGDFDLVFGASKLNLKILEVPVRYKARIYGHTQIDRFKSGYMLLKMVFFAYYKFKLNPRSK